MRTVSLLLLLLSPLSMSCQGPLPLVCIQKMGSHQRVASYRSELHPFGRQSIHIVGGCFESSWRGAILHQPQSSHEQCEWTGMNT